VGLQLLSITLVNGFGVRHLPLGVPELTDLLLAPIAAVPRRKELYAAAAEV